MGMFFGALGSLMVNCALVEVTLSPLFAAAFGVLFLASPTACGSGCCHGLWTGLWHHGRGGCASRACAASATATRDAHMLRICYPIGAFAGALAAVTARVIELRGLDELELSKPGVRRVY